MQNKRDSQNCLGIIYRYKEVIILSLFMILGINYLMGISESPAESFKPVYFYESTSTEVDVSVTENICSDTVSDLDFVENNIRTLPEDDPRFIKYVRARYMIPPSTQGYNLKKPAGPFSTVHSSWVKNYTSGKRNGIFIEAGANEGEYESHTLELEKELGWTGILVECNPTVVPYLRSKHRNAWVAGVCLSKTKHFSVFNFSNPESWTYSGRVGAAWDIGIPTNWSYFDVESVPLFSIIAAAGYTEIDYLSLDVEGMELNILKNFPFDKITIKLLVAEIFLLTEADRIQLTTFLQTKGFRMVHRFSVDYVFVHESF